MSSYARKKARHSSQGSANKQIQKLIERSVKSLSLPYSLASERAQRFPLDELHRRVFKRLRKKYSARRLAELSAGISSLPPLARFDWLSTQQRLLDNEPH